MNQLPEKEIKILDVDPTLLVAQLEVLGASKVFDADRRITHFDTPDARYAQVGKRVKITEESGIKLTVATRAGSSDQQEVKTKVGQEIYRILESLGLLPIAEVTAYRISYEWEGIDFDIDSFPGIPPFLEIDTEAVTDLDHLLAQLKLTGKEMVALGTPEIIARYGIDYFTAFKVTQV